jgi:hypothetical protein
LDVLVKGSKQGTRHADGGGRIGQGTQDKAKAGVNGKMEHFIVGERDYFVHCIHLGSWQKGDAENGRVIEGGEQEVFPSQLGHREGILGVA